MRPTTAVFAVFAVSAAGLLATPTATAAPAPAPAIAPVEDQDAGERVRPVWYGHKVMLADALSLGMAFAGLATSADPLVMTGVGGVALGAPIVHASQGQVGRAGISLGMRLVLPIAGGALAAWSYDRGNKSGECDCMGGMFATLGGMVLGLGTAMVVDAAFLGWKTEAPTPKQTSVSVIPSFGAAPGGGSVGLAGRF